MRIQTSAETQKSEIQLITIHELGALSARTLPARANVAHSRNFEASLFQTPRYTCLAAGKVDVKLT
jgi:hypothetical protein